MSLLFCNKVDKEPKKLYSAYGLTVYGEPGLYEWDNVPYKPIEKVVTSLWITRNGEKIYSVNLGNRLIFDRVFKKTINNFLWWVVKDTPSCFVFEKAVIEVLCVYSPFFNTQIQVRKKKERREIEDGVTEIESEEIENEK